ncbi:MAG: hypothetical protein JW751_00100 [Polyangiaceae bacterium]|nr:hypothetical protein [Polyangiaceae bacterium]
MRSIPAPPPRSSWASRRLVGPLVALGFIWANGATAAEPWTDADGVPPSERVPLGPVGLTLGAEFRAMAARIDELDLGETDLTAFRHRLRADAALDDGDRLRLVMSIDALDGVLWGATDQGSRHQLDAPRSGIGVLDVRHRGPGPRDDPRAYGLVLLPAPSATLRSAYGEAQLPFGRLRFGRQPAVEGTTLLGASGDGRQNRFGVDHGGDRVDRVELLVRPLAPRQAGSDPDDPGLSVVLAYDRLEAATRTAETRQRTVGVLRFHVARPIMEQVFDARATARANWGGGVRERTHELEGLVAIRLAELSVGFDGVFEEGLSDRSARSLAPLVGAEVARQRVRRWGSRTVLRWDTTRVTAYLEFDTASGDATPDPRSGETRFTFPRDASVGLLLFKQVLAYETARTAAAGAARLDAEGYPEDAAEAVATHGAFTGALALFPQLDIRPHRALLLRGGVLLAWAPEPLIDPVRSLDAASTGPVNPRGGPMGRYYGTELDARLRWSYRKRCLVELEGALLDPGSALADAEGSATNAGLVAMRTTVVF